MNEYNERTLKNVLDDFREEHDEDLLKEIEEAANDPLYQNKEGEAEAFAKEYAKKTKNAKKKTGKILIHAASLLLVLCIGISFIPLNVEGHKSSFGKLILDFVDSGSIIITTNEALYNFHGEFVPTYIPDGYELSSVDNVESAYGLEFKKSDNKIIIYGETGYNAGLKVDGSEESDIREITVNGYEGVLINEDGVAHILLATENVIISIICNDPEVDIINFAEHLEKN